MKTRLRSTLALAALVAASAATIPRPVYGYAPTRTKLRRAEIPVDGMTCAKCAANVQDALEHLEGVRRVHIDLGDGRVSVTFDPDMVTIDRIVATIRQVGYAPGTPRIVKAS